jgi:hypothetical protein
MQFVRHRGRILYKIRIMIHCKKILLIVVVICSFCVGCVKRNQRIISQEDFVKENRSVDFANWQGWMISYGSGKYIAEFKSVSAKETERLIFFERNNKTILRLTERDSLSGFIAIDTLTKSTIWRTRYQSMKFDDLKSHIRFVYKYDIQLVDYIDNPPKINFDSFNDEFDLIYLFNPADSVHLGDSFRSINLN